MCEVANCGKPVMNRRMCKRHYLRWLRHGDPLVGSIRPRDIPEREWFWTYVDVGPEHWLWVGHIDPRGLFRFRTEGRAMDARRYAYGVLHGVQVGTMVARTYCDEPTCLRHLAAVRKGLGQASPAELRELDLPAVPAAPPVTPRVTRTARWKGPAPPGA